MRSWTSSGDAEQNELITLNAGYGLLSMDFESSNLEYDVRESGWIMGVGFNS
jgi:hypothetical protein